MTSSVTFKTHDTPYPHSYTSYVKKITSAAEIVEDVVKDPLYSVMSSTSSILAANIQIGNTRLSSLPSVIKGVSYICTVFSTKSCIHNIINYATAEAKTPVDKVEKAFNLCNEISSIALGVLTCFELSDWILEISSTISQAMGNGAHVLLNISSFSPFTVVFSGIEILKNTLEIGLDSIAMYRTYKKIVAVKEKTALWEKVDWDSPEFATHKMTQLQAKQLTSETTLASMKGTLETSQLALDSKILHTQKRLNELLEAKEALKTSHCISRIFGQILPKIKLTYAELRQESAQEAFDATKKTHDAFSAKHDLRSIKIKNWTDLKAKIENKGLSDGDKVLLSTFKEQQLKKLDDKKSNLKLENVKKALNIALKTVIIISLVASIVLTFSGVGTAAGLITSASIMLFVTVAKYGLKKFDQYNRPKEWAAFHIPEFVVSNN